MKTFEIKISGSGTKNQIELALRQIARNIQDEEEDSLSGAEWEDPFLITEIN